MFGIENLISAISGTASRTALPIAKSVCWSASEWVVANASSWIARTFAYTASKSTSVVV